MTHTAAETSSDSEPGRPLLYAVDHAGIDDNMLASFWNIPARQRKRRLIDAIVDAHHWHYTRNRAYQHMVTARGVGSTVTLSDFPRLLRPTAQTFKSYIDLIGTAFPQDRPHDFVRWFSEQLSVELPDDRLQRIKKRYRSLEGLLGDIEDAFSDFGFQISTSSGTSGRSTIMVRDKESIDTMVQSFYLAFQRYMGMQADHRAIFIMPRRSRVAMARMADLSAVRAGIRAERTHFLIPFAADPDKIRIRGGRTLRSGWRGTIEKRFWQPFIHWMNEKVVTPKVVSGAIDLLKRADVSGEKILMFGGWVHLHAIACQLKTENVRIKLSPGSLLGSGGGMKERYTCSATQIRRALSRVIGLKDGRPIPIRDTYGMAEANWAAMQCRRGHFHLPPWIYAVTLDENNQLQEAVDATGMLAFYDPLGGGKLFPAFFKTADHVRLINGTGTDDPASDCPCGENGAYIHEDSIVRMDLVDEAGCAAQI